MLAHSPFATEAALRREFEALGRSGTKVLLWNLSDEHELQHSQDVRFRASGKSWRHEISLRGMLELLHFHVDYTPVELQVYIKGALVKPRNWSRFLKAKRKECSYCPNTQASGTSQAAGPSHAAGAAQPTERAEAKVLFGYAEPLEVVVADMRGVKAGKRKHGSLGHDRLTEYSGVFYYHKGRLTMALEKTTLQSPKGNR
jgi:hypothetical protein